MKKTLVGLIFFMSSLSCIQAEETETIYKPQIEEGYLFFDIGINAQIIPIPKVQFTYVGRYGCHAFDVAIGLHSLIIVNIPYYYAGYQYYFTPLDNKSFFAGIGVYGSIFDKVYIGPNLQFGKLINNSESRWMIQCDFHPGKNHYYCDFHPGKNHYYSSKKTWILSPSFSYGFRL